MLMIKMLVWSQKENQDKEERQPKSRRRQPKAIWINLDLVQIKPLLSR